MNHRLNEEMMLDNLEVARPEPPPLRMLLKYIFTKQFHDSS